MGSELRLTAWTQDEPAAHGLRRNISRIERLEGLLSNWRENSEVQRLNAAAGEHSVRVGTELRDILATARQVSDWSNGKFDVTFGVLSGLWKFDYQNQDGSIPDRGEIARRRQLIDYRQLEVNEQAGTVFLRRKGMVVNLGGIGKGYAVDAHAISCAKRGFHDFMIQFGGDLYAAGREGDSPWRFGIQGSPWAVESYFATVDVSDSTFSTSGDYARFFIKDGRRYHHILDPATGEPAMDAEASPSSPAVRLLPTVSTGVFILGPEAGMALIEKLPDVEGVIVSAKNEVLVSSGLKGRLMLLAPPTDAP
jgi:thiamine biosynthesis lipoprotein